MTSEIKIGSSVRLQIPNCPSLIVESIKSESKSDGEKTVTRQILTCVWFDHSTQTFKRDDFYSDTLLPRQS